MVYNIGLDVTKQKTEFSAHLILLYYNVSRSISRNIFVGSKFSTSMWL